MEPQGTEWNNQDCYLGGGGGFSGHNQASLPHNHWDDS